MEDLDAYATRARAWVEANLVPRASAPEPPEDVDERYTPAYLREQRAIQKKIYEGGFAGITWPAEYGGQGLSIEHERVWREASADHLTPDLGVHRSTTYGVCGPTILERASHDFKLRHVPRMLAGDELWCQFFSEPAAGSDLAGVVTRAERDGDDWVINGAKMWTSGAHNADFGLCLARTDPELPKHQGLTWFAVPIAAPGVTVRRITLADGSAIFCEEFFDDVRVPDAERVGDVNDGWSVARTMLVFERDSGINKNHPPADPGPIAPDLLRLAQSVGRAGDEAVRLLIAKIHTDDYVRRQLPARVAEQSGADLGAAAYGKLGAGTMLPVRAQAGMSIGGAAAIAWPDDDALGHETSDAYLNGRVYSIAGGTNEMQRNGIAERVLGLPRETTNTHVGRRS